MYYTNIDRDWNLSGRTTGWDRSPHLTQYPCAHVIWSVKAQKNTSYCSKGDKVSYLTDVALRPTRRWHCNVVSSGQRHMLEAPSWYTAVLQPTRCGNREQKNARGWHAREAGRWEHRERQVHLILFLFSFLSSVLISRSTNQLVGGFTLGGPLSKSLVLTCSQLMPSLLPPGTCLQCAIYCYYLFDLSTSDNVQR